MVEGVRAMADKFPISTMIVGGMIAIGGAAPAMVAPILDGTTAAQWTGRMQLPVRAMCEPDDPRRPHEAWIRLPAADRGHDFTMVD